MNNIAILASGSGSNAESVIRYFSGSSLVGNVIIITDNPLAYVLQRAQYLGRETRIVGKEDFSNGNVLKILSAAAVNFIVLAGFIKLIPNDIVNAFAQRIVNIHPALLPKYGGKGMYGMNVHRAVIEAQERESGITIHFVDRNYDEGAIIFQARCRVYPDDRPETLAQRIQELEREHYPRIIEELLSKL